MSDKYGQTGKAYTLGNAQLKVDDEFVLATILAVVGLLSASIPDFDTHTAATAARIYEQLKQQTPST